MRRGAALSLALLLSTGSTATSDLAPLPPSFASESSRENDEGYRRPADVRGLYAHGFAGVVWSTDFNGQPCRGSEAEQAAVLAKLPTDGIAEFWFYATRQQGILLTRTAEIDPEKPCTGALSYSYDVERGYIADGVVHSLSADEDNAMEAIGSRPVTRGDGAYSGGFSRIHNLMARPLPNPKTARQKSETIAGIRADCRGINGLVWSTVCMAASGPVHGMILRAQTGDDERMLFSTEIVELRPTATIPGILFEIDRSWHAKQK